MPVSKRDKKISLTKTTKKGMELKQKIIDDIRKFVEMYDHLFVFTVNNMRNAALKELRMEWKPDSRFLFAKKRVMKVALGKSEADEAFKNLHKLANHLYGQCGLLFTNKPKEEVIRLFKDYCGMEYAKTGFDVTETVTLPAGPLSQFPSAIEPHLRSLGMPTQLVKGVVMLREDYTVCTAGEKLKPNQSNILKLLGKKMAELKVVLLCVWSKNGSFEKFIVPKEFRATPTPKLKNIIQEKKGEQSKSKENTPKQNKNTPKSTPQQNIITPKTTTQEIKITPKSAPQQNKNTPKFTPQQNKVTPKSTPQENKPTPKSTTQQNKPTPKSTPQEGTFQKSTPNVPKQEFAKSPGNIHNKTPVNNKTQNKTPQKKTQVDENDEEMMEVESPKPVQRNPRRSMRTPKPIRRTPEQAKQSVKKLTESAKHLKKTPAKRTPLKAKGTPQTPSAKKPQRSLMKQLDVEMGE